MSTMHFSTSTIAFSILSVSAALSLNNARSADETSSCPGVPGAPGSNSGSNILRPSVTSQYEVSTGAVTRFTPNGIISKDGKTSDITMLLTFDFPAASAGKMCSFHFDLDRATSEVAGTGQFDVFTSLAPAQMDTTSWPSGNLRDQHIGRMQAVAGGAATWVEGFPTFGQSFLCPAGQTYGGELVGVSDFDYIQWLARTDGPYITY